MRRPWVRTAAFLATGALLAGCGAGSSGGGPAGSAAGGSSSRAVPTAVLADPQGVQVVGEDPAAGPAAALAAALFASTPVVVVTAPDAASLQQADAAAVRLGAPVLLDDPARLAAQVSGLGAPAVLAVGIPTADLAGRLPGVAVGDDPAAADAGPVAAPAVPATVLLRRGGSGAGLEPAQAAAAAATARAAHATVVDVAADDPRADPTAVTALAAAPAGPVVAAGPGFGPAPRLAERVAVARTGTQLPGGGQVLFPGRALVALYGYPGAPALGVLGEQGPEAAVARAAQVAAPYDALYDVPVVPTFEIIATVASSTPGADGDYSNEASVETLQPMVDAATAAGMYVVLDLQPGRASALEQARRYRTLLEQPDVGLAIDPEWALGPTQKPLQEVGSMSASQINEVTDWLADLVAAARLPQKLLVLHQFRLAMIRDEASLQTGRDEVAVLVHADGQGGVGAKEGTWSAVTGAVPPGVALGWKNFYDEDPDLLTPEETVAHTPRPLMVSYQ